MIECILLLLKFETFDPYDHYIALGFRYRSPVFFISYSPKDVTFADVNTIQMTFE